MQSKFDTLCAVLGDLDLGTLNPGGRHFRKFSGHETTVKLHGLSCRAYKRDAQQCDQEFEHKFGPSESRRLCLALQALMGDPLCFPSKRIPTFQATS